MQAEDAMPRAAAEIMAVHLENVWRHEAGVRGSDDPEPVHDMRVATRRLRASYENVNGWYSRKETRGLRRGLRRLSRRLAEVRDMDVPLERARVAAEQLPEADLRELMARWERRRDQGRVRLVHYLDSRDYQAWRGRFETFLRLHLPQEGTSTDGTGPEAAGFEGKAKAAKPSRVCEVMPAEIWLRYGRVRAYDPLIGTASPAQLHRLRIEIKRLRYTLEAFEAILGDGTERLIRSLKTVQELLGNLHDTEVAITLVEEFQTECATGSAEPFQQQLQISFDDLHRAFQELWSSIVGEKFRQRLSAAVAAL
ncbi:MAG: CHAD domain-containing protein [Dehalococcoidia bacterium]